MDKQFCCIIYRVILKYQLVLGFAHKAYIIELKVWEDGGSEGSHLGELSHHDPLEASHNCTPHVLRFRFSTTSNPLRVTEAKSLALDGFLKTRLPGVSFSSPLLLPSYGNAVHKFPPPSLVSTLLSPSLCGWLLIISKGYRLRSHL